jgi:hypothetical protein
VRRLSSSVDAEQTANVQRPLQKTRTENAVRNPAGGVALDLEGGALAGAAKRHRENYKNPTPSTPRASPMQEVGKTRRHLAAHLGSH